LGREKEHQSNQFISHPVGTPVDAPAVQVTKKTKRARIDAISRV
jgi:hypothetical protein